MSHSLGHTKPFACIFYFFQQELDKKFGCMWHVVAGEEFGFDLDYDVSFEKFVLYCAYLSPERSHDVCILWLPGCASVEVWNSVDEGSKL